MAQFSLNANLNEYMFARAIEDHNIRVREAAGKSAGEFITSSKGRELHTAWLQEISTHPSQDANGNEVAMTLGTMNIGVTKESLVKVLGPYLGNGEAFKSMSSASAGWDAYAHEWEDMTGIAIFQGSAKTDRLQNGVTFSTNNVIPCSPFAEEYSGRETMLEHGTQILYRRPDEFLTQGVGPNGRYGFSTVDESLSDQQKKGTQFLEVQFLTDSGKKAEPDERTGSWTVKDAGPVASVADVSGITRLREFMTPREFLVASRWMERVPEEQRMTSDMTERSVAILRMLDNEGIKYSIKPDQNPGQLKATIGNTKMSVRLTDVRGKEGNNGLYIGRVYNDGDSVFMGPRGSADQKRLFQPTIADTLNVIKYGLGRDVERPVKAKALSGYVGEESMYKAGKDGEPGKRSTFFSVGKGGGKPHLTALYGTARNPVEPVKNGRPNNMFLYIQTGNNHSNAHMDFLTQEDAEKFLRDSIQSARENFARKVNVDYLVEEYQAHADDEDYIPIFSGDSSIAPVQLAYWNALKGNQELYQPEGGTLRDHSFDALLAALNLGDDEGRDIGDDEDEIMSVETEYDPMHGGNRYVGTPEENVRAHLRDHIDLMFGQFEPDVEGKRFSPSLIASYMDSAHGTARNKDNLVAAMRTLEFDGDELRGEDFETGTIKDKLLRFNPETAVPLQDLAQESEYMQNVLQTIVTTLQGTACKVDPKDILVDDMGVVRYEAQMMYGQSSDSYRTLVGEIGQIFQPDADGVVETRYYGSQNKLFTPGYDVYIVPNEPGQELPLEQRYRFRGMQQVLSENIEAQIRYDVHNIEETITSSTPADTVFHTGTTTSVNNTYRGLYQTGYKVSIEPQPDESLKDTYMRQMQMTHMPDDVLHAVFATAKGMCHFDKDIIEGSSVNAEYRHDQEKAFLERSSVHSMTNDNEADPWKLTGGTNMAIPAFASQGLFDPVMTGSGKNQGGIRYLVQGAGIDRDGKPVFSEVPNARAPIMRTADQVYASYIPADRQQMASANYMTASGVAGSKTELDENGQPSKGVGVAQLTLQGLTFDDGAVISKKFAEQYGVIGEGGQLRPLMPGDKLCDMAGNKSIIARVIDPDMPLDEAKAKGIDQAVLLFKNNPSLDVVQAPYSAVSRFNAAGVRHAMENPEPLVLPDGSVHPGCIGFTPMTITHHTAEDHTKGYDDDDVKQGKGRKVSTQQSWMLTARGATALMKEIFDANNSATVNMREYLNTLGYDMSETGRMRMGYQPHNGEERFVFQMPGRDFLAERTEKDIEDITDLFNDTVGSRGGMMELPFPLKLQSGVETGELDPSKSSRPDMVTYQLPVMSSHLRSGQTFEDGTKTTHDYTNQYQAIYKNAVLYVQAQDELASPDVSAERREELQNKMLGYQRQAQQSYDGIADDVFARKFESKHNVARDELMARRMPNSATAVWTPDPMLGVNQVAMPQSLANVLGVKEGERVMVNRDPLLRVYGMRDMEVVIDNELHGVAVHPAIAVSFDGDFDGDSVGLWAPKTAAAKEEAYRLFSFEQNMLDFSRVRDNGDYALMFNDAMDIISAESEDKKRHKARVEELEGQYGAGTAEFAAAVAELPETLESRRMRLEHEFNEVYRDTSLSYEERRQKNEDLTSQLSEYARDVMVPQVATELISYENPQKHMESLITVVDHGAKGSMKKLDHYMKFAGFEADHDETGRILADTVKDVGHTLATDKDIADTEQATAIKAHGTGNAGAVSQRASTLFRNRGLAQDTLDIDGQKAQPQNAFEPALRLTYLATQGILQAKHDPVQAQMLYAMINSDIRNLWRGYSMEQTQDENGAPRWKVRYDDGKPIQATPEEWIQTFMDMHTAKNGLDLGGAINIDDVRQVAHAMTTTDSRGREVMMNMEDQRVIEQYASSIDILAYRQGDARDILHKMAEEGRSLFDGQMSQYFAPEQVRKNMQAEAEGRLEDLKPLQPADTKVLHNTISQRNSAIEIDVRTVEDPIKAKDVTAQQATAFVPEQQAMASGKSMSRGHAEPVTEPVADVPIPPQESQPEPVGSSEPEKKEFHFNYGAKIIQPAGAEGPSVQKGESTPSVGAPSVDGAPTGSAAGKPKGPVMPGPFVASEPAKRVRPLPDGAEDLTRSADHPTKPGGGDNPDPH